MNIFRLYWVKTCLKALEVLDPQIKGTMGSSLPFKWKIGVSLLVGIGRLVGGSILSSGCQLTIGMKPPILYLVCRAV